MPVVEAHLIEGYADEAKARLAATLSAAVTQVVPAPPEAITVLIHEVSASGYSRGGPKTPAPALPDPVGVIRGYLDAMEARDLDAARAHLGEGFAMRFPGAPPMTTLAELIAWAAPRYRFVRKAYEGFDVAASEGQVVVFARGTLSGEWPDGTPFEGVRFIDRFALEGGKIVAQDVWNDLAEVRP